MKSHPLLPLPPYLGLLLFWSYSSFLPALPWGLAPSWSYRNWLALASWTTFPTGSCPASSLNCTQTVVALGLGALSLCDELCPQPRGTSVAEWRGDHHTLSIHSALDALHVLSHRIPRTISKDASILSFLGIKWSQDLLSGVSECTACIWLTGNKFASAVLFGKCLFWKEPSVAQKF